MFAAVASTSTNSFPVCSATQKTKCIGSHLLHPLVLYTTMAKKAGKGVMAKKAGKGGGWKKGVMAKKAGKGGGWKPWVIPQAGKGVTTKAWRKAMTKKKNAFAKAQSSHCEFNIAMVEVRKAQVAYFKAAAKAEKLKKRAELDAKNANALE